MNPAGIKHPGRWLWLLVAIPVVIGFARIRLDLEVLNLLPEDIPAVQGLKIYQQNFTSARELVVTFRSPDPEGLEKQVQAAGERLRQAPGLVRSATWQPPWTRDPAGAGELLAWLWLNQPPTAFAELTNRILNASSQFTSAREQLATSLSPADIAQLSYDPLGFTRLPTTAGGTDLFSGDGSEVFENEDGTFRILFVEADRELLSYKQCEQWLQEVKRAIESALKGSGSPTPVISFTGRPAFVAEIGRGMHDDIRNSIFGTALIIALLFWIAHRSLKPLLWLLALLGIILAGTLGLGAFVFGTIHVISMGFAAILLGLAVDYALLHYQEAVTHIDLSVPQVRRVIAPGVAWAAITTIAAFLSLNLGGLPGLAQLGTIVALGVALGAVVIVFEYLPPLFPSRNREASSTQTVSQAKAAIAAPNAPAGSLHRLLPLGLCASAALLVAAGTILLKGLPALDSSANALRPSESPAYTALAEVQQHFSRADEPVWMIISAKSDTELLRKTEAVEAWAERAKAQGRLESFTLPTGLLPHDSNRHMNAEPAAALANLTNRLRQAAAAEGFEAASLGLAESILRHWAGADSKGMARPASEISRWTLDKVTAGDAINKYALGLARPASAAGAIVPETGDGLPEGVWLSSWPLLGQSVLQRVKERLFWIVGPMTILVLVSLVLAFRRASEVLLSLGSLGLAGLALLTIMKAAGWSWNLMNLMAVPLILGTGVDYGIFIQLALRRHEGNLSLVWRSTGRALLLCAGTAIAGFGSLAFSSNSGMAGLGRICAAGIACNAVIAVGLLPVWWLAWHNCGSSKRGDAFGPSALYNAGLWNAGMRLARTLPAWLIRFIGEAAATIYWAFAHKRRRIVRANLLPALRGDREAAEAKTISLFRRFGRKIADLLRYEAGESIESLLGNGYGYDEHLAPVSRSGRGALLLTVHLGNWEFGASWLVSRGVELKVVTQQEPGAGFTELREAARRHWNVQTVVVGHDPFAFLDVVRLLDAGAVVALLVDRPPAPTGVEVELFGQPFSASVSAAELARATGCALLPTYIVWSEGCYEAHMLPEVLYDRASLRQRENRQCLTQEIMKRFEPVIRRHIDQWFHFVPLWKQRR